MDRFQKLLEDPHKFAREWKKETEGKVIGYFSHYFPEEIAYAAGILPVSIFSKPDIEGISQRYLYNAFCPYSLGVLAQGLNGSYDYLDGIVHVESCMPIRGAVANWWDLLPVPFKHYIAMPSQCDEPSAKDLMYAELKAFKRYIEDWTGKPITEEALDHAIDVYNTNRILMREVYELRRLDNPPVSGTEALAMVLSSQIMDKEEHNKLLKDAIDKLKNRKEQYGGPRLMLLGSEISGVNLVSLIESTGANIVIDRVCNGSNYFWNPVIPQQDRLLALTFRYLDKPRHPVKDESYRRRVNEIVALAIDYNVQGVVYAIERFCFPHQQDRPAVEKNFKQRLIPIHEIEYDGTIHEAEYINRIEAFIGSIKKPVMVTV
ncbi:MAG: 2-hydroxyacyl-CoA dehydratase [Dehalococcoidales bacterium]|nr:2-hydroxyacyl-CoA dehydratase [Dehalococcoidales bacterium]